MIIGDLFAGGMVIHINDDGLGGIVGALEDIGVNVDFGSFVITNPDTTGSGTVGGYSVFTRSSLTDIGTGLFNTEKIATALNSPETQPNVAQSSLDVSLNGFNDWYLPSKDEAAKIAACEALRVTLDRTKSYWTSSEIDLSTSGYEFWQVYCLFPSTSSIMPGGSSTLRNIRPVRTFTLEDPVLPIKPAKPTFSMSDNYDQYNVVPTMTSAMEFSIDGAPYALYGTANISSELLSGNNVLRIRIASDGFNPASDAVEIPYTATVVNPTDPVDPTDPATADGLKDIAYALRVAYKSKLSVVKHNNVTIPIYDGIIPGSAPDYFIVIKDITEADDSLKQGFNTDVHITLDIVTRFQPGTGSSSVSESISGQVNSIICTHDTAGKLNLLPDFHVMNSVRTISRLITEQSKTYNVFRKVNMYKHVIQQLT